MPKMNFAFRSLIRIFARCQRYGLALFTNHNAGWRQQTGNSHAMRKLLIFTLLLLSAVTICRGRSDVGPRRAYLADSIEKVLERTSDPKERLRLLYDRYDLAVSSRRGEIGKRLYNAAVAAKDTTACLDVLRLRANAATGNDSLLASLQKIAELMPPSRDQKQTVTFIRILRARTASATLPDSLRAEKLHELLMTYSEDTKVDQFRRIEMLGTICMFLKDRAGGKLLFDYLSELQNMVDKLPNQLSPIRSNFYVMGAVSNTRTFRPAEAIEHEKKLIDIITRLEKKHHREGRRFCNYDERKFICYRRMLFNHEALTREEIEYYYVLLRDLVSKNEELAAATSDVKLADAMYYDAIGDYNKAIPMLIEAARNPRSKANHGIILHHLIKAAKAAGNDKALLDAYNEYLPIVEERSVALDSDRVLEFQILHDLTELRATNASLSAEVHNAELENRNNVIAAGAICLTVVLIVLVVIAVAYRRSRRMANEFAVVNAQLTTERDALKKAQGQLISARDEATEAEKHKSDFITTISHEISGPANAIIGYSQLIIDSVDGKRRPILDRFVKIIELNAQLLKTLVNDVLDVAELENSQVVLKYNNVRMKTLCEMAADSVSARLHPDVTLNILPEEGTDPEVTIDVDCVRADQVLVNLLSNAIKFTDHGHINIIYGADASSGRARFAVEDTGPGIPEGKEKIIFERFEKIGNYGQGIGLGLHICRKVAALLGGEVTLDRSYKNGARFVFTLPLDPADAKRRFAKT